MNCTTFYGTSGTNIRLTDHDFPHGRPVRTRFGEMVDVRNRGALRLARMVGIQIPGKEAPAVVRLWNGDNCRELSIDEARSLAEQLLDAARFAEQQNTR